MLLVATLYALATAVLLLYGGNLCWLAVAYARTDRALPGPVPAPDAVPALPGPTLDPDYGPAGTLTPLSPLPVVTVQLPLYNEVLVAERLIDACVRLDYPRLEIQVLDDSTDETVALVERRVRYWRARGVDIVHIHRAARDGYKAGALRNGLRLARGAFIAVFDADFLPPPDFLARMLPRFDDPDVGMVQARWGHLNADESLLTRIQAFGLDAHFAVEQYTRNRTGLFMNFNGTAGLWRRRCIETSGNWQGDTLAEDLDLSYRAQLAGWTFRFAGDVEVPAELPVDVESLRSQQFRWAKGSVETALKLLDPLWRSDQSPAIKVEGTFHLTAHFVFPFMLLAALLHAPLLLLPHIGYPGPGAVYFALLGLGLLGLIGFFLVQLFAQRALYPDWPRRALFFPFFMAGTMGLALSNTRAIVQAFRRKQTAFVRTPKYNRVSRKAPSGPDNGESRNSRYAARRISYIAWFEAVLALYCGAGLVLMIAFKEWAAVPFQALFAVGFGLITLFNLQQLRLGRARA